MSPIRSNEKAVAPGDGRSLERAAQPPRDATALGSESAHDKRGVPLLGSMQEAPSYPVGILLNSAPVEPPQPPGRRDAARDHPITGISLSRLQARSLQPARRGGHSECRPPGRAGRIVRCRPGAGTRLGRRRRGLLMLCVAIPLAGAFRSSAARAVERLRLRSVERG